MSGVLLVNMPFANLRWPSLGLGLLKAALARRAIDCRVAYLNFDFAERISLDHYHWLADHFAFVLGGERLFARHYFQDGLPDDESYYRRVLLPADPALGEDDRRAFEQTARHVEPFLDACIEAIEPGQYDVVGFTASFQQTMPSLCLARRLKQLRPELCVVFGGAACEGEMGVELLRQFPPIDYVFLGEADLTFPQVVEQLGRGRPVDLPPGVVGRDFLAPSGVSPEGHVRPEAPPCSDPHPPVDPARSMVRHMDELPYPDFDDYFDRLGRSPLRAEIEPLLFFETSRGCWWGEKHQCVFCGLNGSTLAYRSKSPRRAVDELRYLADRHQARRACAADNVLDPRYCETFLPLVKEAGLDLAFAYEMRANLAREQVEALLESGLGAAQLGIETFSTPVLRLIRKGVLAIQNLQTLKWFSAAGIEVKWNLLYGFPGEDPADYAALAELLPSLGHLAPPQAVGRVRMDRFSPYFQDPAAYGMTARRAHRAFGHVYPFPPEVLARLAHYFEFDYVDGRNPDNYAAAMLRAAEQWQAAAATATLRYWDRSDGVLLLSDTRPGAAVFQRRLTGIQRAVYLFCDPARSLQEVVEHAAADGPQVGQPAVRRMLQQWVDQRIMACLDNRYLSLALPAPSDDPHRTTR